MHFENLLTINSCPSLSLVGESIAHKTKSIEGGTHGFPDLIKRGNGGGECYQDGNKSPVNCL